MEPFDVVKNIRSCFILRAVIFGVDPFSFHHTKKSLTGRIVCTMANRTYTAYQVMLLQQSLIFATGKL